MERETGMYKFFPLNFEKNYYTYDSKVISRKGR